MDTDTVGLPSRRVAYRLRAAREEATQVTRRRECEACGERRACAPLDILAFSEEQQWFCLTSCWTYQLGVRHGEQGAARRVSRLVEEAFRVG